MALWKNQTLLDLEFEAGVPLATATVRKIIMIKPDNSRTELEASYDGTKITYSNPPNNNIFNQEGRYRFQGRFVVDGREGYTDKIVVAFGKTL
jgi:hypothetical protein